MVKKFVYGDPMVVVQFQVMLLSLRVQIQQLLALDWEFGKSSGAVLRSYSQMASGFSQESYCLARWSGAKFVYGYPIAVTQLVE